VQDPKEYLPFLRELRALDKYEQRFRIDDQLERRGSALRNLAEAGPSRWQDASSYMARYELFEDGFRLYAQDEENLPVSLVYNVFDIFKADNQVVHDLYGDYLYDRREFADAALCKSY
jgi:elongator complex protein 1